ncbi:MAG: DUF4388 domain-containing protein [Gemmatimonadales bacterium]|nr:DUF4388 domain-containing protein [Gemmatimonadales bacterium]
MALKGQLSDFNLAEILQLIASQQKSGFLNVEAQRSLVFIFDKGFLISTRDRRVESRDPLRSYLKAYGFFNESDWKNIDYVEENSNLDLTEILLSEDLLNNEELDRVLRSMAQEMTHQGMKLHRGRYDFNPTKGVPPGVRSPYRLDVQGLLMEAARRLDEEQNLKDALPSPEITFSPGPKDMPQEDLSPISQRIMELALSGLALGKIIRQGHVESFVVLDLLNKWCTQEILVPSQTGPVESEGGGETKKSRKLKLGRKLGLRSFPLIILLIIAFGSAGWARWIEMPIIPSTDGQELREAQLRSEVINAAQLYRYTENMWPETLTELVRGGQLSPETMATVLDLGWKYNLNKRQDHFTLTQ